ncbi:hypothetical protein GCM10010448_70050 [Streptomyces glomeratus]|uniref:Tc1-like transposase DDE domain-containing protein n=1 Tax=Streptomyces glomeratus TaxID=284452 RepID=A0ABP6M6U4_9ACTN
MLRAFIDANAARLTVVQLPAYAPDLNPTGTLRLADAGADQYCTAGACHAECAPFPRPPPAATTLLPCGV